MASSHRHRRRGARTSNYDSSDDSWAHVDDSEDGGYDGGSAGEEDALHESGECGRSCCGNPNSDDDEDEYHDRNLCGPACCGTPSQDDANALIVLDAAVAAARVPPGTVGDAVFTDVYLEQLLLSYQKRHAQFCRHRRYYSDRMLVPYLVWNKVHAEFLERFLGTNFDALLLKTHLRRALFASNPPNYYCTSSERKHYAQPASASTTAVGSAVSRASASKVPVVQAIASANVAATHVAKAEGTVSRAAPLALAARPAPTPTAAEQASARRRTLAKAARTRSVAAQASLLPRAVPASRAVRPAKAAAPAAARTFAEKRASVNTKTPDRGTAIQIPASANAQPTRAEVDPLASHPVAAAAAAAVSMSNSEPHAPTVLVTELHPGGNGSSVNGSVPISSTQTQTNDPVLKRERIDPASASMAPSATIVAQQQQAESGARSPTLREDSDSSSTEASSSGQAIGEDSSPQQQESQRDRRQKRRLRASQMELLELKKQKVALENLKLARELGIITQQECMKRGRRRVPL